jgi:hypothetical protein
MRKFVPAAAAAIWLLAVAGAAMAQAYPQGPLPPTGPSSLAISTATEAPLPASTVGQTVWSNRNDAMGTIVAINGDTVIVRAGGMHIVPRDHLFITGSGAAMRVGTMMTGADLRALPKYEPPRASASR